MRKIALLVPELPTTRDLVPFLRRVDAARWYSNFGPLTKSLEAKLRTMVRSDGPARPSLCSVSNCTVGLELALTALRLKPHARVLLPALTFVASATAVARAGYEPVLGDIDAASWLLTPEIARKA